MISNSFACRGSFHCTGIFEENESKKNSKSFVVMDTSGRADPGCSVYSERDALLDGPSLSWTQVEVTPRGIHIH